MYVSMHLSASLYIRSLPCGADRGIAQDLSTIHCFATTSCRMLTTAICASAKDNASVSESVWVVLMWECQGVCAFAWPVLVCMYPCMYVYVNIYIYLQPRSC